MKTYKMFWWALLVTGIVALVTYLIKGIEIIGILIPVNLIVWSIIMLYFTNKLQKFDK